MHEALVEIVERLKSLSESIEKHVGSDEPFSIVHGNWSFPGVTKNELIDEINEFVDQIENEAGEDLGGDVDLIQDYVRRIKYLQESTVPQIWGNSGQAGFALFFTLRGLRRALDASLKNDIRRENIRSQKLIQRSIRAMEARLKEVEPKTLSLEKMIERIENAHSAADQLPTDMENLAESRSKISGLEKGASKDHAKIEELRKFSENHSQEMKNVLSESKSVLDNCQKAYSASTSVGLAAAFNERSSSLSWSMWAWVIGLVLALVSGSYFGSEQLKNLSSLLSIPDAPPAMVTLNILLALLSVGAPVWFAWLATKQIGQRFRLSEDYAFKASISRAYEGYRREAARIDPDMEAQLLASELTRLDELPLRWVEPDSHGSPWHELLSSEAVKGAVKTVPGFVTSVKSLASDAMAGFRGGNKKPGRKLQGDSPKKVEGDEEE